MEKDFVVSDQAVLTRTARRLQSANLALTKRLPVNDTDHVKILGVVLDHKCKYTFHASQKQVLNVELDRGLLRRLPSLDCTLACMRSTASRSN